MPKEVSALDLIKQVPAKTGQVSALDLLNQKKSPVTTQASQSDTTPTTEVSSTSSTVSEQVTEPSLQNGTALPPITLDDSSKSVVLQGNTIPPVAKEDLEIRAKIDRTAKEAAGIEGNFTKKQDEIRAKEKTLGWKTKVANYLKRIIGDEPQGEGIVTEAVDDPTPIDINAPIEMDRKMYGINPETGFPTLPENIDPELRSRVFMSATKNFDQAKKDFEQIKPVLESIKTVGQAKRAMGWIGKDLNETATELSTKQKELDDDYKRVREINKDKLAPLGAFESFEDGISQTTKANEVADMLLMGDDAELSKTLEEQYMKNVLYGDRKVSEVSQMLGGQVKPLGVVFTSALLSGGNPIVAGGAGTAYYGRMGAGSEAIQAYSEARSQGMSPTEALAVSKKQAVSGGIAGAAEGLVGSTMPVAKAIKPLLKISSPMAKAIITGAAEAGTDAIAAAGAQTFNNYNANENGLIRDLSEGVADQATAEAMFSVGFQLLFHGAGKLSSANYKQLVSDYAKYPLETIQFAVDDAVKSGTLDYAQASRVMEDVAVANKALQVMPKDLSPEKEAEVLPLVEKKQALEEEKKALDKTFHGAVDEKIDAVENEIKNIVEPKDNLNEDIKQTVEDFDKANTEMAEKIIPAESVEVKIETPVEETPAKPFTRSQLKKARKELLNKEPSSLREAALQFFVGGGKVNTADVKRYLGTRGKGDWQDLIGKHKGGDNTNSADLIAKNQFGQYDEQEVVSALFDVIQMRKTDMEAELRGSKEQEDFLLEHGTSQEQYDRMMEGQEARSVAMDELTDLSEEDVDSIADSVDEVELSEDDNASIDNYLKQFTDEDGIIDWKRASEKADEVFNFETTVLTENALNKFNSIFDKAENKKGYELERNKPESTSDNSGSKEAEEAKTESVSSAQEQRTKARTKLEEAIDGINSTKEQVRNAAPEQELTKAQKAKQNFKEKLILAKALRDKQDRVLGANKDPLKEAEERAKADREVFDAAVEVAKEYIKETADKALHTVEEFAKYVDEKVEDVKAAWEEATKEPDGVKKTIVTKRAYEGTVREEVKKKLEEKGLTRTVISQQERSAQAEEIINELGEDLAIEAVKNFDIRGARASAVLAKVIKRTQDAMSLLEATDTEALDALAAKEADLINFMGEEGFLGGEFNSQLAYEYEHSDIGYNSVKKIADWKKEFGEEPPAEMMEKWKERDKEFEDLNKKLAEAEERARIAEEKQAVADIKESVEREKKSKRYTQKARRVADEIRKLKSKPIRLVDENGNVIDLTAMGVTWNEIIETVAKAVEAGGKLADAIDSALKDAEWYSKLTDKGRESVKAQIEDALRKNIPSEPNDKINIPHQLIRDWVEKGVENIDQLVYAIKQSYPDKTSREIRDAITGYGKTVNPNKEEIEMKIRKMKRIGKAISALEDIANKKRPLRSGQQRDKLDADERAMQKELREAMKELPADEADLEQELKTQLDATKQRVQNQIEDLEREIKNGELTPKSARTVKEDAELKELKEKRDALKKEHDEIFKDEEYKQAKRLELTKKATQKRIEDLERRIAEGDFSKKKSTPLIADSELIKIKADKLRLQEEYDKEFYKQKLLNRTKAEVWKDRAWDAWGLARGLSATGEASFVGIQGLVQTIAHPLNAIQAFKNAAKFFASPAKTEAWLRNIKAQDFYPTLKSSKLALTEPHAEITAREELFYSGWTDLIWNTIGAPFKLKSQSAFDKWKAANPIKAIERASVGYLDTLRVLRFLDGMEVLNEQGKTFENSPQDFKDVADSINTLTGRASLGFMEQNAEKLSKLFFSPRNWASQFKTATPYALYHFGKMTPTGRKMAIADFSKFVGLTTSAVMMVAARLNNDDDENTGVEFDPRSSDFMKIRLGKKRVDPWGGRIQQVVLSARLLLDVLHDADSDLSNGGMKTAKGEIVPLGTPFKAATKGGVALKMAINKLSPSAALLERYMMSREKKDGSKVDEYGKPYSFTEDIKESLRPIYWGTVADLIKDDPNALNGLLAFYAFFGGGVNVYDKKGDKATSSTTSTPNVNVPVKTQTYIPKINMGKLPVDRLERK